MAAMVDLVEVYVFESIGQLRFTENGADDLAIKHGYSDLTDSYEEGFHYYTHMTTKEIDEFLND